MKKIGKIKRIGLTATVFFLCLAMLITCFTVRPSAFRAFAEPETSTATTASTELLKGLSLDTEVEYGEEFAVPAVAGKTLKVTAPNNDDVTASVASNKLRADQMGIYKITYTDEATGISYDFGVKVTFEKDYFLWVDANGADIPTYVVQGTSFELPTAKVMYYNDDNILTEFDGDYSVTVEDYSGKTYDLSTETGRTFVAPGENRKTFITYTAKIGGATGTKHYSRTFTLNVQAKINNGTKSNPQISVSGIQRDASVNRPVTLPVAKATDANDDNVKVEIKVYEPDGETLVKNVKVDDDGYAYETLDSDVVFDNDKSMTFYPTKTGTYKVTYTAYNDSYDKNNPANGGKSGTNEFSINVADHVAPVFKKVDEYLIPETWGKIVKSGDSNQVEMSNKIKFTVPEVVDNKDHAVAIDDKDTDLISVYFRITDSDNSRTVVEVKNILSNTDNKMTKNDVYTQDVTFDKTEGFTFDFDNYARKDKKGEPMTSKAGTYTVLYRARDKANNTSSKTYTVTMKDEYEDLAAPSTAEVTAPEYISAADETFTVPYPVYSDANDTRPYVVYRMYTDATTEDKYIAVDGGEEAKLVTKTDGRYVVINEGKDNEAQLKLGNNLYFYVYVQDKVGNIKTNGESDLDLVATPDGDITKIAAVTKIVGVPENSYKYIDKESDSVKYIDFVNAKDNSKNIKVGDTVLAGRFAIETANLEMRAFTGFEVSVIDPNGNSVGVTLETVSVPDTDKATIYVQNIKFTPSLPTTDKPYVMTVRVFDVNGKNDVYGYTLNGVAPSKGNDNQTSATPVIGTTGSVNVKYKLNNEVIKGIPDGDFYVVRKISGGKFSLMGSEFVAMTQGSYSVQDGYIAGNGDNGMNSDGTFAWDNVNFGGANEGVYNFSITDSAAPVIELQDKMPSYKEKDATVVLPKAIAYTENGMGVIEIEVKDPDTNEVKLTEDNNGNKTFVATKDGAYTVTYTGTYKNASPATATYTINVGDVFAPVFTTKSGTNTTGTKKEGDTFEFATIVLEEGEESTGVTITKEIYDPSGEIMSSSTVNGSYSGYADKKNNGSEIKLNKVGDYKIVYTVKDAVGNDYQITDKVTVASQGSSTPTTWTTLSTVLIVVAIVLLAGVIIYVVRFRKVKK